MKLPVLLTAALLAAVSAAPAAAETFLRPDDDAFVRLGEVIYDAECAACHGADLEGEPDWRTRKANGRLPAPPHDESGHTWHHSDRDLILLTAYGPKHFAGPDYDTDMPAYAETLTTAEIIAVLSYIKSTWPDHIRDRQSRLNTQ
jgi:mono/diheme cytochrome c family protein